MTTDQPARGEELVVLVDEAGRTIGTAPKATVHTASTPLHRAFSCYLFDPSGQLLLTRRAAGKKTFPGLWTNSVCGHPGPDENDPAAITRRARHELGLIVHDVAVALPGFRYRAESGGVVENEICPVYLARTTTDPVPHRDEVAEWTWTPWGTAAEQLARDPGRYSPWYRAHAAQLHGRASVSRYLGM